MKVKTLLTFSVSLLFLSCTPIQDMRDSSYIRIQLKNSYNSGRYVASDGEILNLSFLKGSSVYLHEKVHITNGSVDLVGIPPGDYSFIATLSSADSRILGLACRKVTIEPGENLIRTVLGPGIWGLIIDEKPVDMNNPSDEITLHFKDGTLQLDLPDRVFAENESGTELVLQFLTNADFESFSIQKKEDEPGTLLYLYSRYERYMDVRLEISGGARSFRMVMTAPDGEVFPYEIHLH